VEDATVSILKGAIEAVVALAGHAMAETDPELGANLMVFFIRDWSELTATPGSTGCCRICPTSSRGWRRRRQPVPRLPLRADGAIKAAFVFVRMDAHLSEDPGRDHRAQPGGADDPALVGHGVSGTPRRLPSWPRVAPRS
jgi:hypothetical protein